MKVSELTSINFKFQLSNRKMKQSVNPRKLIGFREVDTFADKVIEKNFSAHSKNADIIDFLV